MFILVVIFQQWTCQSFISTCLWCQPRSSVNVLLLFSGWSICKGIFRCDEDKGNKEGEEKKPGWRKFSSGSKAAQVQPIFFSNHFDHSESERIKGKNVTFLRLVHKKLMSLINLSFLWQDSAGGGAFTGFSGFSFKPMTASTPFSFNTKSQTNGKPESKTDDTKTMGSAASAFSGMGSSTVSNINNRGTINGEDIKQTSSSSTYLQNLKSLNQCLLSWTKKHVDQNPYCLLTPIFKDYEKHLAELDKEVKLEAKSTGSTKLETIQGESIGLKSCVVPIYTLHERHNIAKLFMLGF